MISDIRVGGVTIALDQVNIEGASMLIDRCKDHIKKEGDAWLSPDGIFINEKVSICQRFDDFLRPGGFYK